MRKCEECGFDNLEGTMVCEDCGFPIVKGTSTLALNYDRFSVSEGIRAHTVMLNETTNVGLEFVGYGERIDILPNQRTVFGRADSGASNVPDVDLSPFGAFDKGVSRIHAALIRQDATLTLLDLDSSNGTLINGRRVSPHQPRVVQDGDEITFGQLVARVSFK
jgi:pSer/pThr/pTyr-binding forkhead associated (FHA) protein